MALKSEAYDRYYKKEEESDEQRQARARHEYQRYLYYSQGRLHAEDGAGTPAATVAQQRQRQQHRNDSRCPCDMQRLGDEPVAADLPDSQVWQLVAYIGSLSTDPANIDLPGSVVAGSRLFRNRGDCNSCHMIDGEGGRLGPDLSRVGERRNPEELLTDILDPHQEVAPRWWTMRVTDNEGVTREGLRMNEDSFSLRIMDAESNLWSYQKRQLASIERVEESTMPSYTQTLSDSDVDDLVAYLFSLRKEN